MRLFPMQGASNMFQVSVDFFLRKTKAGGNLPGGKRLSAQLSDELQPQGLAPGLGSEGFFPFHGDLFWSEMSI